MLNMVHPGRTTIKKDGTPRKKQPEIYILFFLGFKPQEIIKLGYSEGTTYKYHKEYPKIIENLKSVLVNQNKGVK